MSPEDRKERQQGDGSAKGAGEEYPGSKGQQDGEGGGSEKGSSADLPSLSQDSWKPPGQETPPDQQTPPAADKPEHPPVEEIVESSRFRVLRRVGEGGMGEVWLAEELALGRQVAIKFARGWAQRQRFQREAEITALLEHPGVVPVLVCGKQDGRSYYVMRYVEGERFDQAIARWNERVKNRRHFQKPEVQLAFRGLLQRLVAVWRTVAYAHSKGVVHRDLKPNNIILGRYGETIVLDWGLARRVPRVASA